MTSLSELRFFVTPAHECSYIAGREAITLFADPGAEIDTNLYSSLSDIGFRRSGDHIYRPYCQQCSACIPVRTRSSDFNWKRRHKRVMKRNNRVTVQQVAPALTEEYFSLYKNYIDARHSDGDMYPADQQQFVSFLVQGRVEGRFYEFREDNKLIAVCVADRLNQGLSAIYTFFDPNRNDLSPGVFAVLWLIQETQKLNLPYLYLGYWIKESQKMNYKIDYQPLELYLGNHWREMTL